MEQNAQNQSTSASNNSSNDFRANPVHFEETNKETQTKNQAHKERKIFGIGKKETSKKEGEKIEVEKNLGAQETKIKDLTETLQRLQAEFENYQKRSAKQNEEYKTFANAKLIDELLPVLDSLEQGMKHNKELVLLHEQLFLILKKNGLQKINAEKGQAFDHCIMECLMQEKNEKLPDGAVANVLIEGYLLNGKILRLAKVSVNGLEKNKDSDAEEIKGKGEQKEVITKIEETVKKMESD